MENRNTPSDLIVLVVLSRCHVSYDSHPEFSLCDCNRLQHRNTFKEREALNVNSYLHINSVLHLLIR